MLTLLQFAQILFLFNFYQMVIETAVQRFGFPDRPARPLFTPTWLYFFLVTNLCLFNPSFDAANPFYKLFYEVYIGILAVVYAYEVVIDGVRLFTQFPLDKSDKQYAWLAYLSAGLTIIVLVAQL